MKRVLFVAVGGSLSLAVVAPASAQDINTTGSWDGSSAITPFGKGNTATYGQTFTVGSDEYLNSFSFWLKDATNGGDLLFSAFVMGWDGTKATGSILWQSDPDLPFHGNGTSTFQRYDFSTGSLELNTGQTYIAFLNASNYFSQIGQLTSVEQMGVTYTGSYAGGQFVWKNNGNDFSKLTTEAWECVGCSYDAAFVADFSAGPSIVTPEPVSMALLGTGLFGVGAVRRRRRKVAELA